MAEIIRRVRDIDDEDRKALEHVVGRELREDQQVIIRLVGAEVETGIAGEDQVAEGALPDWCNVYEGLSDEEIDEMERSIVRSKDSRLFR